jgi:RHS repeat-associated protein
VKPRSERIWSCCDSANRTSRNAATYAYGPGFRLASAGAESFGYDGAGRVTSLGRDGGVALAYDSDDHVTSVTRSGGTTSYAFDGSGRRVGVSSAGTERRFLVAPSLAAGYESPHLVTDGAGATLASYVYAGEHALARYEASGPTYYLRDAMGSVIALADESGARVARLDYDAFGNVRGSAGSASGLPVETAGDFRYHGMWMDPTGLYYVRARSYDPVTGRFVSKDPVEGSQTIPETQHPYAFTLNQPTLRRDPSGEYSVTEIQFGQLANSALQSAARRAIRNAVFDEIKDGALNAVSSAVLGMFRSILPSLGEHGVGDLASLGHDSVDPRDQGNALEALLRNVLCNWVDSDWIRNNLHLEAGLGSSGKPTGSSFTCSDVPSAGPGGYASLREAAVRARPDFLFSGRRLSDVTPSKRTIIVGDAKLSMRQIESSERSRGQLRLFGRHARNYSASRIVFFLTYREPSARQKAVSYGLARTLVIFASMR